MKKLCLTVALVVTVLLSSAQVQIGIFAGPQASSAKYEIEGVKQSNSSKYGFQLGAAAKVPFESHLYFAPAVFYSMKGYKVSFDRPSYPPDSLSIDNNTTIHTFELAALFQVDLGKKPSHFFVKFGPTLDFAISGKEKFNRSNHTTIDRQMKFSFTQYGRYGANVIAQLGYENKKGFFVFGQYTRGLGTLNNFDGGPGIWHRVIGLSVGKYLVTRH